MLLDSSILSVFSSGTVLCQSVFFSKKSSQVETICRLPRSWKNKCQEGNRRSWWGDHLLFSYSGCTTGMVGINWQLNVALADAYVSIDWSGKQHWRRGGRLIHPSPLLSLKDLKGRKHNWLVVSTPLEKYGK